MADNTQTYSTSITCADGAVCIDPIHQGRIFAKLDGVRVHRYDEALANNFHPVEFNNLGGNSLWPAPEGGDFAYNYLDGDWLVQPGVNTAPSEMVADMTCERTVTLSNHKAQTLGMTFRREVSAINVAAMAAKYGVKAVAYHETDTLTFDTPRNPADATVAAWSLEQFAGAEGIIAFGRVKGDSRKAVNTNFYGNPLPRLAFGGGWFKFTLGGEDRLQIGVSAAQRPQFIGAFVPAKSLMFIRRCAAGVGTRIDIADNDQPNGIYGADDQYSIFNGATLDFFELETIAPVVFDREGRVAGSLLSSESYFFKGARESLLAILRCAFGMPQEFVF